MYEVEVKVPARLADIRDLLSEIDATALGTVIQEDTYYDAPHRSFAETDEALRIRSIRGPGRDTERRITYKGPLVDDDSKTREELETAVASGETVDAILSALGFDAVATVTKERERYVVDDYTVVLDDVEGVGEFVEVEAECAADSIDATREGAFDVLRRLELDPDDQLRTSYLELGLNADAPR